MANSAQNPAFNRVALALCDHLAHMEDIALSYEAIASLASTTEPDSGRDSHLSEVRREQLCALLDILNRNLRSQLVVAQQHAERCHRSGSAA